MPDRRRPPRLGIADLVAILLALAVLSLHFAWLQRGSAQMEGDESTLVGMVACAHGALTRGDTAALWSCPPSVPYPPLVPLSSALMLRASVDLSLRDVILTLLPWEALLLFAAAWGARRAHGGWGGIGGVALASGVFGAHSVAGHYYTELPMAALALLGAALWDRSDGLRRPLASLALGLCLGLGLLIKWSFAFFWGPPMALALAAAVGRAARRPMVGWLAGISALVGVAAVGLWALGRDGAAPLTAGLGLALALIGVDRLIPARPASAPAHRGSGAPRPLRPPAQLVGAALLALGAAGAAAPWYLRQRRVVAEFLRRNLEGEFAGDPMPLRETWSFYPVAFLNLHGIASLSLITLGVLAAAGRPAGPGARALAALVCGAAALAAAPYRADRYLVAGLGLLVPVMVGGLPWRGSAGPVVAIVLGLSALVGQGAWLAEGTNAGGWLAWGQGGVERIIFGNTADDIAAARARVLGAPLRRYTLLPPPRDELAPLRAGLDALAASLPAGQPWEVAVADLSRPRCAPCLAGELSLRGAGLGSAVRDDRAPGGGPPPPHRSRAPAQGALLLRLARVEEPAEDTAARAERWTAAGLRAHEVMIVADPVLGDVQVEVWVGGPPPGAAAGGAR